MGSLGETIAQIRKALIEENPEINRAYYGIATHIVDMQNFYLVPLSVYRLMHRSLLEKPGNFSKHVTEHMLVIYLSPILGHHARGMVMQVRSDGSCVIFAIDYGVTDMEVTSGNIFTMIHEDAENLPGLAQWCELSKCFPRGGNQFSLDAIETFKFFMGENREKLMVKIINKSSSKLEVLVTSSRTNPDDISKVLGLTNNTVYYAAPL